MNKVSFDFDHTLKQSSRVQSYARQLVDEGCEVWIVTRRFDSVEKYTEEMIKEWGIVDILLEHNHIFELAEQIGIDRNHIVFMNMEPKYQFFRENPDFIFHLDDDSTEVDEINKESSVKSILFAAPYDWMYDCDNLIFEHYEEKG